MTGVPGTVGRPGSFRAPAAARANSSATLVVHPLVLRTAAFLALALFAAAHWAALVQPAQTRRAVVAVLVVTIAGVLINLSAQLPRLPGLALRLGLTLLALVLAVAAMGIRLKLLMPAGWGTLNDRITGGLSAVGTVGQWPYAGPNTWLRLTTLLAAPLVLTVAALFAFWPRTRKPHALYRAVPLVLLVGLYGIASAARPFESQALRGVALLACLAAWLWLPRLTGRDAGAALAALGVAGLAALLLTPTLASSSPWIDYRHWSWTLHHQKTIAYNWTPAYGPLHWPRKGTTMLLIKSKHPHYWKAETLDTFDGRGWKMAAATNPDPTVSDLAFDSNQNWTETARITVRGLKSGVVIGPGTLLGMSGLPSEHVVGSNATYLTGAGLANGDTYTVTGYTPDPSMKQMRAAPPADLPFLRFTTLTLPMLHGAPPATVQVPIRKYRGSGDANAVATIRASRYAPVYALAKDVTSGVNTQYDMVRRIGAFLEGNYQYDERVPRWPYPLETFLLRDKRGYCQHFAGAAALMLRMLGIPTRVVTGFAPGTRDPETREFVVRDLDAHSWIEVWFQGIGWVPFDPTPAQAPASSQAASFTPFSEIASAARGDFKDTPGAHKRREDVLSSPSGGGHASTVSSEQGTPWFWVLCGIVFALLAIAAIVVTLSRRRLRRKPLPAPCGDADVDHLVRTLARLGLEVDPGTTLLDLEKRMQRLGGPAAAGYAERLRRRRYGATTAAPPTRTERRKLRHALAAAVDAGLLARLQLAMPDNLVTLPGRIRLPRSRR